MQRLGGPIDGRTERAAVALRIVSAQLAVGPSDGWFVDSITDITYRLFDRREIHEFVKHRPDARTAWFALVAQEIKRSDDLIVHLGRGSAEQRVAYLVTRVLEKLKRLGIAALDAVSVPFPLRQHHIADATGLTPVHVSNILGNFRSRRMFEIEDRKLTILDWNLLRRVAALHPG